ASERLAVGIGPRGADYDIVEAVAIHIARSAHGAPRRVVLFDAVDTEPKKASKKREDDVANTRSAEHNASLTGIEACARVRPIGGNQQIWEAVPVEVPGIAHGAPGFAAQIGTVDCESVRSVQCGNLNATSGADPGTTEDHIALSRVFP